MRQYAWRVLLLVGGVAALLAWRALPSAPRWQYQTWVNTGRGDMASYHLTTDSLNALGAEGWELVAVTANPWVFYFKRQVP